MPKSKSLAISPFRVTAYEQLAEIVQAFSEGHLKLLFVLGDPGIGKSQVVRQGVPAESSWINGTVSAFGLYSHAFRAVDQPLILDDVDGLHADRNAVRVLKCLCQTDDVKSVSWETHSPALEREGIPRTFETSSSVAIIANDWNSSKADVQALMDRGHAISFEPSKLEIHRQAATWFHDQEVFEFIADHLHLVKRHSLRLYVKALQQKQGRLDWQKYVLSRFLTGTALEVARFLADPQFATDAARIEAFTAAGHGSRATWFNHARRQRDSQQGLSLHDVASIRLARHETPPGMGPTDEPNGPNSNSYRPLQLSG